jgi:hypothetical protein
MDKRDLRTTARVAIPLLLALALAASSAPAAVPAGLVSSATGTVEIGRGEPPVWQPAREGQPLEPGDLVRTGAGGRAAVEIRGATARLYENSMVRIPLVADGSSGAIWLERGSSLFNVFKRGSQGAFEVQAAEVVVSVKGTRFAVVLETGLAVVSVQSGTVGVRTPESALELEVLVHEGFAAAGGSDRPFELMAISGGDPWGVWEMGAPLPDEIRGLLDSAAAPAPDPELDAAVEVGRRAAAEELAEIAPAGEPELGRRKAVATRLENAPAKMAPAEPVESELDPLLGRKVLGSPETGTEPIVTILETSPAARELQTEEVSSHLEELGFDIRFYQDHLYLSPDGQHSEKLTEDKLEQVIDEGDVDLLGDDTLRVLQDRGVDPSDFAEDLAELLNQLNDH